MYTVTVKTRKIINGREMLKIFTPLIIWEILMFLTFLTAVKTNSLIFILLFIIFFAIIPVCYGIRKRIDEFRGEKSFVNKEVTFNVVNHELYIDNRKMNVTQRKSKKLYIDDIGTIETKYKKRTYSANFIGIIEEPYSNDFIDFLNKHGVKIQKHSTK